MRIFGLHRAKIATLLAVLVGVTFVAGSALAVPPGHLWGSDAAPVFMEVWVDYADSVNLELDNTLHKILNNYGSRVQLVVKPFPVRGTEDPSYLAAEAGECVAAQGEDMFWQFHQFMLQRRGDWTLDSIWQWAQGFQAYNYRPQPAPRFSYQTFANCWKGRQMRDMVGFYVAQGYLKDVETTPTTLVISRTVFEVVRFEGAIDYASLSAAIDRFLGAKLPPYTSSK